MILNPSGGLTDYVYGKVVFGYSGVKFSFNLCVKSKSLQLPEKENEIICELKSEFLSMILWLYKYQLAEL